MLIETTRLIVRSFETADIPAYTEIVADLDVVRFLGDGQPHSPETAAAYVRDCIAREATNGISRYGVHLKESDQLIGFCGFKEVPGYIDFGWRYDSRYWRKGYGTEAAEAVLRYGLCSLHLTGIIATSYEDNIASVRIIEKLGFVLIDRRDLNGRTFLRYELRQGVSHSHTKAELSKFRWTDS